MADADTGEQKSDHHVVLKNQLGVRNEGQRVVIVSVR